MRLLLIDHYDSFTAILADYLAVLTGQPPQVLQHDDPALCTLDWSRLDAVVLSPGPGHPAQPADARHTDRALAPDAPPLLGVCLGMQLLVHRAGGTVQPAAPWHGRVGTLLHDQTHPLLDGIPSPTPVARYHSLRCDLSGAPDLLALARCAEDGALMAVAHRRLPRWGVQHHPESIATAHGHRLLHNFLRLAGWSGRLSLPVPAPTPARPSPAGRLGHRVLPWAADGLQVYRDHLAGTRRVWLDGALSPGRSRYSLLGDDSGPCAFSLTYRCEEGVAHLSTGETLPGPLKPVLRALLARHARPLPAELPLGPGLVGYLGYELRAETVAPHTTPASAEPDAAWIFLDRAIVIDHQAGCTHLLSIDPEDPWLQETTLPAAATGGDAVPEVRWPLPRLRHSWEAYAELIARCDASLRCGDSYELCLTNQATLPLPAGASPLAVYTWLRQHNPAPHAALLEIVPGQAILSSSPERFLAVDRQGTAEARPIKGTRPRHPDPAEDNRLRDELASAEKDRAENLMITDLLRNDLAGTCVAGSVRVPALFQVERYATVHQLVSVVQGTLRPDQDALDAIWAAFPGGSMTGMPKRRSMELLEALEAGPRGVYAGALGYLSVAGTADLSIVIRTLVLRDGLATVGCGGAIVVDSVPEAEVAEARLKLAAVCPAP